MRKLRSVPYKALFLLALLAAGAWLAQHHVANQRYYPVSKLASADGYTFHLVQGRAAARAQCGAANDRFLERIKLTCPGCEVVYARCERELQGLELALVMGDAVPHFVVQAPGVRLAMDGPRRTLQRDCEHIAEIIVNSGVRSAACVFPGKLRTPWRSERAAQGPLPFAEPRSVHRSRRAARSARTRRSSRARMPQASALGGWVPC